MSKRSELLRGTKNEASGIHMVSVDDQQSTSIARSRRDSYL